MYAIVNISGKQFKASEGMKIRVPKQNGEQGSSLTFNEVLLLNDGANNFSNTAKMLLLALLKVVFRCCWKWWWKFCFNQQCITDQSAALNVAVNQGFCKCYWILFLRTLLQLLLKTVFQKSASNVFPNDYTKDVANSAANSV